MLKRLMWVGFAAALFVLIVNVPAAHGQAVYGSIVGNVTDAQGAALAGAKVTITNLAKGKTEETTTDASGSFTFLHLIPDTYKVRIEATGFKAYDVATVQVQVDSAARVDAQLEVGAVTQSIEVTGEVPQLQTEKSEVSTNFSAQTIENLPIYNRNFTSFQLLTPGNQRMNGWNHAASENPQGSGQIMTQGQHFAGTGFELDGTDNQDPILGIIVINPNLESVGELKITAQDYDAEFGKAIGIIMTTETKSGTNQWHGNGFDFQRSNSNFARNPFTQAPGVGKPGVPSGNWNQFGAAIGGPIKKDKLFVFGDYQGLRSHIGGAGQERVPTSGELTGNFSDLAATATVYDPYMTTDAAHTMVAKDASGNPIFLTPNQRTQANCPNPADFCGAFPGNAIPAGRISPVALALLKDVNVVGTPTTSTNPNFFGSGNNVLNADNFDTRVDYTTTAKLQIFGRYSFQQYLRSGPGLFGTLAGGRAIPSDPSQGDFAGTSSVRNQSLAAGFNYTVSPTLLTDVRFGYFRYRVHVTQGGFGTTPATDAGALGLNGADKTFTSGMPYFASFYPNNTLFAFGYALGAQSEGHCNCPLTEQEYQYQIVNNWTKIHGKHQIKFGADIRRAHNLRVPSDAHRSGEIQFTNDITQGVVFDPVKKQFVPDGGIGFAGFLLGTASNFRRYVSTSLNATEVQPRFFFYGQDTWHVTSKLTVNLGLRWEIYRPESAAGTALGGWVDLGTGEVRVAGQNGVNLRGNTSTDFAHLAPRVGIAYQVNPKTVIRLGYGRSYDIGVFGSIFGHFITQNLPVLGNQSLNPGTGNIAFLLNQGPPSFNPATALGGTLATSNCNPITDPTGVVGGVFTPDKAQCVGPNGRPLQPDNVGGNARPFNNRLPTVDAWNATLQRQVTSTITATVAYVGNKGTHTFIGDNPAYNPNSQTEVGYFPGCSYLAKSFTVPDPATCPNGALPLNSRKPYYLKYGWTQGLNYAGNDADSEYEALQATVEKRFANGLSFNGNYSFQHANNYDNNGYFNINKKIGYGPSNDYRNNVFILTEVYQLPFGKGKKWASSAGRVTNALIGGWSINSATNFSSGLPFNYGLNTCQPSTDNGPCRPDLVGTIRSGTHSGSPTSGGYWFSVVAPTLAAASPGCLPVFNNNVEVPSSTLNAPGCSRGSMFAQPALDSFGDVGRNTGRGPRLFNTDLALFKDFTITERAKAQFQFQVFNIFNHVNLDLPNGCVDCSNGGSITNIAYGSQMRALQFGLKLSF
jgi:outer membrane receptor protein involved in Fe transport